LTAMTPGGQRDQLTRHPDFHRHGVGSPQSGARHFRHDCGVHGPRDRACWSPSDPLMGREIPGRYFGENPWD
jgi:hypothetical protein